MNKNLLMRKKLSPALKNNFDKQILNVENKNETQNFIDDDELKNISQKIIERNKFIYSELAK